MLSNLDSKHRRRDCLQTIGRLLAFSSLTGIGVLTLRSEDKSVNTNPNPKFNDNLCQIQSLCQGCKVLSNCSLPQAIHTRHNHEEANHG